MLRFGVLDIHQICDNKLIQINSGEPELGKAIGSRSRLTNLKETVVRAGPALQHCILDILIRN